MSARGADRMAPTAAELFGLLWGSLSGMLGSATTATLLRRSTQAVARARPELADLRIDRDDLEYRYVLPASWSTRQREALEGFRRLMAEVRLLLLELTGEVVLSQLDTVPAFGRAGIVFSQ